MATPTILGRVKIAMAVRKFNTESHPESVRAAFQIASHLADAMRLEHEERRQFLQDCGVIQ